jgi:hypothetical protein
MNRFDYVFAALLGGAYIVLVGFLVNITVTWGDFISSDGFWGQSTATAVAYMQLYHSIGVGLAAIPVGLAIAWRYAANWRKPAVIVAIIGSSYMLFDQVRGVWALSQNQLSLETSHIVSGSIDVVKVGLILFIATAILKFFLVPWRARAQGL